MFKSDKLLNNAVVRYRCGKPAIAIAVAALAAGIGPAKVAAQSPANQQAGQLEEVIVTARRRNENLQEIPVSVTAFTSADIEAVGITDISHISELTPNLIIQPNTGGNDGTLICMRGLCRTDFTITEDPMVGVYLDGVYIGKSIGSLFDVAELERIEVLRGPQGTLYGKNTLGGAVILHTRKPSGEFGAKATLTAGNFGRLDGKVYVDIPVTSQLAASVAVLSKRRDPFVDNNLGDDIWDEDNLALQGAVQWNPSDAFTVDYAYDWQKKRERAMVPQVTSASGVLGQLYAANVNTGRADEVNSFGISRNDTDLQGHALTLTWELGDRGSFEGLTLKSVSGYRQADNHLVNNVLGTATPLLFNNPDIFDVDSRSQEFQLSGSAFNGYADFVVGAFYFNEQGDYLNTQQIDLFSQNQGIYTAIDNTSKALFAEVTFNFTEKLKASVGLRYTDEEREQEHSVTDNNFGVTFLDTKTQTFGVFDPNTLTYSFTPQFYPTKIDGSSTAPRLSASYQWNDDLMTYITYARGFKSGGFNARSTTALQWGPYDDMQVDSYEVGFKSDWADNRVRFNLTAFREEITDGQTQVNAVDADNAGAGGFSTVVQNAAEATIIGLEAELVVQLIAGLNVNAGYGYVDPEYDEFISFDNLTGELSDISDDRAFEFTPENSYNVSLNYTFPQFSENGTLHARLDWAGQSKVRFTPKISGNNDLAQQSYDLFNARLSYADIAMGDGALTISLWGRNLTDEEYKIGGYEFDISGFGLGRVGANQWGEPRTYGLDVSYRFGSVQ